MRGMGWMWLFVILLGGGMLPVFILLPSSFMTPHSAYSDVRIELYGETAMAKPTQVVKKDPSAQVHGGDKYFIDLEATTPSGKRFETRILVENDDEIGAVAVRNARNGTSIAIEYDPENPARARLSGSNADASDGVYTLAVCLFGVFPLLLITSLVTWRRWHFYRWGEPILGRVESVAATHGTEGGRDMMRLRYSYLDRSGKRRTGKWDMATDLKQGDPLWVLTSASWSRRSVPVCPS